MKDFDNIALTFVKKLPLGNFREYKKEYSPNWFCFLEHDGYVSVYRHSFKPQFDTKKIKYFKAKQFKAFVRYAWFNELNEGFKLKGEWPHYSIEH